MYNTKETKTNIHQILESHYQFALQVRWWRRRGHDPYSPQSLKDKSEGCHHATLCSSQHLPVRGWGVGGWESGRVVRRVGDWQGGRMGGWGELCTAGVRKLRLRFTHRKCCFSAPLGSHLHPLPPPLKDYNNDDTVWRRNTFVVWEKLFMTKLLHWRQTFVRV